MPTDDLRQAGPDPGSPPGPSEPSPHAPAAPLPSTPRFRRHPASPEAGKDTAPDLEAAVRLETGELFRTLVEQVEDHAVFILTPDGRNVTWNPGVRHVFGYEEAEFLGAPAADLFTPEDRAAGLPARELGEAHTKGKASDDRWLVRKDGTRFWASGMTYALQDAAGRLLGYGKVLRDLTPQKQAQDALAASETALRLALAAAQAGTWRYHVPTRTQVLDDNLRRMLGLAPEAGVLAFEEFLACVHSDDRAHLAAAFEQALARGGGMRLEFRIVRPDGTLRWLRDHGEVLLDAHGRPEYLTGTAIDVTDHRATEERLRQSQRIDAVGKLAGGVAHEINNMMGVVLGLTEELLADFPPGDRRRHDLEQVRAAAGRATSVTAQLLAFSRRQLLRPTELSLDGVVTAMQPVLARLIGPDRTLTVRTASRGSRVRADRGQLEQLLINLALNARDVLPPGGRLRIETANVVLDAAFAARYPEANVVPGPYLELSVSDTGPGMDAATLARVFEPFFTTKPAGQGAGLGLATVYGIVKQSGGYVWAESEPGQGATFRVYLPALSAADTPAPAGADPPTIAAPPLAPGRTALVVDDEELVRRLIVRFLARLGYTCLEAGDGLEALEVLRARQRGPAPVDLVISDLVMPSMNGRELAERLGRLHPDLPVLFISGYTDDEMIRQELLVPGAPFLQKPFSADALAAKLRLLLRPAG